MVELLYLEGLKNCGDVLKDKISGHGGDGLEFGLDDLRDHFPTVMIL